MLLASGLSGATTATLTEDELGCKLNGYVGATATREERAALRAEVSALAAAMGPVDAAARTANRSSIAPPLRRPLPTASHAARAHWEH